METNLIALKLLLGTLNISPTIDTVDDRKRIQKTVYLAQLTGLDLGYRFGWYLRGPYCPSLTRDYYALADALSVDPSDTESKQFSTEVTSMIKKVEPLFDVPKGIGLAQEDWLELVASLHFLRKISGYDEEKTIATLQEKKSQLAPYALQAKTALTEVGML